VLSGRQARALVTPLQVRLGLKLVRNFRRVQRHRACDLRRRTSSTFSNHSLRMGSEHCRDIARIGHTSRIAATRRSPITLLFTTCDTSILNKQYVVKHWFGRAIWICWRWLWRSLRFERSSRKAFWKSFWQHHRSCSSCTEPVWHTCEQQCIFIRWRLVR
jgi:hypothetical protein